MEYFDWIGCDVHKDYSVFRMFDAQRKVVHRFASGTKMANGNGS